MPERRNDCAYCHRWLPDSARSHRKYCGPACRQADYRRSRATLITCELCGREFLPLRGRQKVCDYSDQAVTSCRSLQDELAQRRSEAEDAHWDAMCAHCGDSTGWNGVGRPRRFCAPRCRTAFYRAEKRSADPSSGL
jgi:endogenous inhibitor of DNA gyrase (YacG/DUF329 family)